MFSDGKKEEEERKKKKEREKEREHDYFLDDFLFGCFVSSLCSILMDATGLLVHSHKKPDLNACVCVRERKRSAVM